MLRPGQRVVDLGCWPGGWLQVAAKAVGAKGRVVGVDLVQIEPLPFANVIAFSGDLSEPTVSKTILEQLQGPADVLLCDAAPKRTGVRSADRAREEALLEAVEVRVPELLRAGGTLVMKLIESPEAHTVARRIGSRFGSVRILGLQATRKGSSEKYLLATDFET